MAAYLANVLEKQLTCILFVIVCHHSRARMLFVFCHVLLLTNYNRKTVLFVTLSMRWVFVLSPFSLRFWCCE